MNCLCPPRSSTSNQGRASSRDPPVRPSAPSGTAPVGARVAPAPQDRVLDSAPCIANCSRGSLSSQGPSSRATTGQSNGAPVNSGVTQATSETLSKPGSSGKQYSPDGTSADIGKTISGPAGDSPVPGSHTIQKMPDSILSGKFRRESFILSYSGPLTDIYSVESKKLGQGTYGFVSRAVNRSTKAIRAVKTISKSKVKNIERFRLEIAIMKELDHPNIVKLFETFEDHKNIYLILELCTGGELFDRIINRGYFTEHYAATLMHQVFAALYYCNQHNIVHRDLKPENFLFLDKTADSPLKIIDFGLAARISTQGGSLKTKAGTPYYVAPQVLQGKYDSKCDVWSAGVIMYIFLCGYPPFHGDNDTEILHKVKTGRYTFNDAEWNSVSSEAKDLIRRLLCFDPSERITANQALNHPWLKNYTTKNNPSAYIPLNRHILSNFRSFQAQSKLKKATLTVIAQQMSESQIVQLKTIFEGLDKNGDGTLTIQEMREGLKFSGLREIPKDLELTLQEVDSDGSGGIDYTEFIAASIDKRQYIQEDVCWAAFRVFDLDGNGRVTAQELLQVLGNDELQGAFTKDHVSEVRRMIHEVDQNGDGEIDFDEFMEMMKQKNIQG